MSGIARTTFYYYKQASSEISVCTTGNDSEVEKFRKWASQNATVIFIEVSVIGQSKDVKKVDFLEGNNRKFLASLYGITFINCSKDLEKYCTEQLASNGITIPSTSKTLDDFKKLTEAEKAAIIDPINQKHRDALKLLFKGKNIAKLFEEKVNAVKTLQVAMNKYFLEMKSLIEFESIYDEESKALKRDLKETEEMKKRIEATHQMKDKEYTPTDEAFLAAKSTIDGCVADLQAMVDDTTIDSDVREELRFKLDQMKKTKARTMDAVPPSSEILKSYDYTKEIRKMFIEIIKQSVYGSYKTVNDDIDKLMAKVRAIRSSSKISDMRLLFYPFEVLVIDWLHQFSLDNYRAPEKKDLTVLMPMMAKYDETLNVLNRLKNELEFENAISSLTKAEIEPIISRINIIKKRIKSRVAEHSTNIEEKIDKAIEVIEEYDAIIDSRDVRDYEEMPDNIRFHFGELAENTEIAEASGMKDIMDKADKFGKDYKERKERREKKFIDEMTNNVDDVTIQQKVLQFASDYGLMDIAKTASENIHAIRIINLQAMFLNMEKLIEDKTNDKDAFFDEDWKVLFTTFKETINKEEETLSGDSDIIDQLKENMKTVLDEAVKDISSNIDSAWKNKLMVPENIKKVSEFFRGVLNIMNNGLGLHMDKVDEKLEKLDNFLNSIEFESHFYDLASKVIEAISKAKNVEELNKAFDSNIVLQLENARTLFLTNGGTIPPEVTDKLNEIIDAIIKSYNINQWFIIETTSDLYKNASKLLAIDSTALKDLFDAISIGNIDRQATLTAANEFINHIKTTKASSYSPPVVDDIEIEYLSPDVKTQLENEYNAFRIRVHEEIVSEKLYESVSIIDTITEIMTMNENIRLKGFIVGNDELENDIIAWCGFQYANATIKGIASGVITDSKWEFETAPYDKYKDILKKNTDLIKEKISANKSTILLTITETLNEALTNARGEENIKAIEEKILVIKKRISIIPPRIATFGMYALFDTPYIEIVEPVLIKYNDKCYTYMKNMLDIINSKPTEKPTTFPDSNILNVHFMDGAELCKLLRAFGPHAYGPICMHKSDLTNDIITQIILNALDKAKSESDTSVLFIMVDMEFYKDIFGITTGGNMYSFGHHTVANEDIERNITLKNTLQTLASNLKKKHVIARQEDKNMFTNNINDLNNFYNLLGGTSQMNYKPWSRDTNSKIEIKKLYDEVTKDPLINTRNSEYEYIATYPEESIKARNEYRNNIFDVIMDDISERI